MKMGPTVFVVDDDPLVRRTLMVLIRSVDLSVEAFESAHGFLGTLTTERAGCLVLDVRMPSMTGLELQQELHARGSTLPIIMLTGYGDVATAVQAFKAGAFDFVEKPLQNHRFLEIVQAALRHDEKTRTQNARKKEVESRLALLTAGERRVLDAMMDGKCYKTIAKNLDISYKTVQARRGQIMKKMGASDFPGLAHLLLAAHPLQAVA